MSNQSIHLPLTAVGLRVSSSAKASATRLTEIELADYEEQQRELEREERRRRLSKLSPQAKKQFIINMRRQAAEKAVAQAAVAEVKAEPEASPVVVEAPPAPPPVDIQKISRDIRRQMEVDWAPKIRQEVENQYRKNLEDALKQQQDKMQTIMQAEKEIYQRNYEQFIHKMDAFIDKMRGEVAHQVINRSLDIAEIILRHSLPDRDMLASLLKSTLEPISDLQGARVRVHPQALDLMRKGDSDYEGRLEIIADGSLQPGDIVIESRNGIFDARISQRLEILKEQLRQRVGHLHGIETESKT